MTQINASLSDFADLEWDEGTSPRLLISAWGVIDPAISRVEDKVVDTDALGDAEFHLLPTVTDDGFYSVQFSWLLGGAPRHRFIRIRVPVEGPVRLTDLVVSDDEG